MRPDHVPLRCDLATLKRDFLGDVAGARELLDKVCLRPSNVYLRVLVYLVIYDSGKVSFENLLPSRHPSQNENPLSRPTLGDVDGARELLEKVVTRPTPSYSTLS